LNKGFEVATGEIYGFLNSDDLLLPGALRKVKNAFQKMPSKDVISGNTFIIDEQGIVLRKYYSRSFSILAYVYGVTIAQSSTFFRASVYRNTKGFNIENRVAWDGELWVDLALSGANFGKIDTFLSCFRVYPQSISGSRRMQEEYTQYHERMFRKVKGRERASIDQIVRLAMKAIEYSRHPRELAERLVKGPVIP
jgi:glycosyltransferase involved in cell wall biosynthesis